MDGLWTAERILALAPDPASAKSGRELASVRKWVTLGRGENVLWGECQGSAKDPYRTQIDLTEPAFKCSCPSRKFPCKHSLGLFLLSASTAASFKQDDPPKWVAEWLAGRAAKAEQKAKKKEDAAAAPVDPAAAAKRIESREKKIAAGLAELDTWLCDLVRTGLATAQSKPYGFWEAIAARMVDAQAAGLARLLREAASIPSTGEGWQPRLLELLGRIHLIALGYQRQETLPDPIRADVRSLVGWTQSQDELLATAGIKDTWLVCAQAVEIDETRLRTQRTWLLSATTRSPALILTFAHGNLPFTHSLVPGTVVDAEVVYFPSATPLRALLKPGHSPPKVLTKLPGQPTFAATADAFAEVLSRNPFLDRYPLAVSGVIPHQDGDRWLLRDREDAAIPLAAPDATAWTAFSLSGGHPIDLFGEYAGESFVPLSAVVDETFVPLTAGASAASAAS